MKLVKTLKNAVLALCCALTFNVAAQDAAPAAPAAVAPAANIDALLKFIPAVVVEANGKTLISREELLTDLKPMLEQALQQNIPVKAEEVELVAYNIAESLAISKLILAEAAKQKLEGDKQAAAEQLKMMEEQINAQQPGAFDNELKKIGMTREKIMDKLVEQSIIQQYVTKLAESAGKISAPTEKELKDFFEQNQAGMKEPAKLSAAHILIQFPSQKPTDDEKAAALKQIQDIRKQLKEDGSNFAELAKTHSACPSKAQGGDLGNFEQGQMVKEFEDALLKLKEGQISEPVETLYGYHIIKAGPTTPEHFFTFDEVKEKISQYLTESKTKQLQAEAVQKGIEAIKKNNLFKCNLPMPAQQAPIPAN